MAFKHQIFDLDFRNENAQTQKATIDTFFQNNAVESWSIADNETIAVTYDDGVATKPTRFDVVDVGVDGVKGNLSTVNTNVTIDAIVSANHVIHQQLVEDRHFAIQYKEGVISVDTLAENQRVSDDDLGVVSPPVYAEIATQATATQQTGITATYVKIDQFDTIVRQKNMTISGVNNNITINKDGLFRVDATVSFTGTVDTNFEVTVFVNDVAQLNITSVRKTGSGAGDVGAMALFGTVNLSVDDVVDLRVSSDDVGGANFRVVRANFILNKVR